MMNIELEPELEQRLEMIAQERSQPVARLIEEAVLSYLNALEGESAAWVKATEDLLPRVWPAEDFRDWMPPDDR